MSVFYEIDDPQKFFPEYGMLEHNKDVTLQEDR
jgi:hypothetical protein